MRQEIHRLAILDVGHGNCAVLHDTDGVIVIDAGRRGYLLEYLRQEGIDRVETVLVSHADEDHIGGLIALLASQTVEIGRVCLNSDAKKDTKVWEGLLKELDRSDLAGSTELRTSLTRSGPANLGDFDLGAVRVEILGPSPYLAARGPGSTDRKGKKIEHNSISAVVRLSTGKKRIALFPGDLDEVGLDDLAHSHEELHAPLMVYPHHGGRSSARGDPAAFARRLCELVRPELVVLSIGRGKPKTPRPEVIEAIRQCGADVRIACTQLSRQCADRVSMADASHLSAAFAAGRETRSCCAGTLVLDLETPGELMPTYESHQDFIIGAAPKALCRQPSAG